MGFGTLFCGYFLLLNFAYYAFTDAVSAVLMLYALYKLSRVNISFKRAMYASLGFFTFGTVELLVKAAMMIFTVREPSLYTSVVGAVRYAVLLILTYFILSGIREVASEVKLHVLSDKAARCMLLTLIIYSINILLEIIGIFEFASYVLNYLAVIMIVLTLTLLVINLTVIYSAYMRICMPGDEQRPQRPSRLGFINAFRRHEEEKQKEYAEYRLQKEKQRKERRRSKCKKK